MGAWELDLLANASSGIGLGLIHVRMGEPSPQLARRNCRRAVPSGAQVVKWQVVLCARHYEYGEYDAALQWSSYRGRDDGQRYPRSCRDKTVRTPTDCEGSPVVLS